MMLNPSPACFRNDLRRALERTGALEAAEDAMSQTWRAVKQLTHQTISAICVYIARLSGRWRNSLVAGVGILATLGILATHFFSRHSGAQSPGPGEVHLPAPQSTGSTRMNASTPSTGQPRVHIAYVIQKSTSSLYNFDFSHVLTLLNITSASISFDGDLQSFIVHVLSTDADLTNAVRMRFPGIRTHHLRLNDLSTRARRFKKAYVHQSVNPADMERFCLVRWIVLADLFASLADASKDPSEFDYILAVDSDVAMFMAPHAMINALGFYKWQTFESHEIVAGAMILWRRHGLESFANHIVDFYGRDAGNSLAGNIQQHGVMSSNGCRPEWSTVLPCPNATHMWHLSDVYVWRAWAAQNPYSRTIQISSEFDKSAQTCDYIEQPLCADKVVFKQDTGRLVVSQDLSSDRGTISAASMHRGLCFIHFQGGGGKQLIPEFYTFVASRKTRSYAFVKTLCLH